MAKIGIKNLTFANYQSGGVESAVVYTGGVMKKDYMVRGEVNVQYSNEAEHADDHRIDVANDVTGISQSLELANLDADMLQAFAGLRAVSGQEGVFRLSSEGAPYIGVGYEMVNRFKGVVTYEGLWIYKIKFRRESVAADTKADNLTFSHENVAGDGVAVTLAAGEAVVYYDLIVGQTTESAVETWLKGKAGIT